ncbi:proton-conducting transporter membrane subunit [Flavobacterium crassostreae]|uniref:Pesticidal protein Cry28Aa n=1 Tax=Flavobacterium crassostreae TaxID=1763534 RepID=A0A1B9E053_9FLAO|nr:proton-conducting transporter membrane subunit [Flavobacterium crassostreae]OCB75326.1 pesticidal protein Cry28Aa [Flavobacterium crassostreae]
MPSKNLSQQLTNRIINYLLWFFFLLNSIYLVYAYPFIPELQLGNILKINGFTLLIWNLVTFFSALLSTYAIQYLKGFKYHTKFSLLCLGFTITIMIFVMANNVFLLLAMWMAMGIFMSQLIGSDSRWEEAKEASRFALKYFVSGSIFLSIGVLLLAFQLQDFTLSGITSQINTVPQQRTFFAALCIIMAALIQSAIYPFHRWLLSAMTAPTPASALMHAGFVNGSGILLTLFSTVLVASNTLSILFVIGGLTAVLAQFTKLLQVNVKQRLACSTIAQMGFMIMQCGLGFFNAAVVHLILHGFYKAQLFLSANEEIGMVKPTKPKNIKTKPWQALLVLLFGMIGAYLFNILTGKVIAVNSGIFLTLIVAITVGQVTHTILKEKSLSSLQKIYLPILLFSIGIVSYALVYNCITSLMQSMPMIAAPQSLTTIEIGFGVVFLVGFFIMKLGIYRKYPHLYMTLLNLSQPAKRTILLSKSK